MPQDVAADVDHIKLGRALRAREERCTVRRNREPFHRVGELDAVDGRAAGSVNDRDVVLLHRCEHLASRVADCDPVGGGPNVDPLHVVGGGIYHEHRLGLENYLSAECRKRSGRFVSVASDEPIKTLLFDKLLRKGWIR